MTSHTAPRSARSLTFPLAASRPPRDRAPLPGDPGEPGLASRKVALAAESANIPTKGGVVGSRGAQ